MYILDYSNLDSLQLYAFCIAHLLIEGYLIFFKNESHSLQLIFSMAVPSVGFHYLLNYPSYLPGHVS